MTSIKIQPDIALGELLQDVGGALEISIVGIGAVGVRHVGDQVR